MTEPKPYELFGMLNQQQCKQLPSPSSTTAFTTAFTTLICFSSWPAEQHAQTALDVCLCPVDHSQPWPPTPFTTLLVVHRISRAAPSAWPARVVRWLVSPAPRTAPCARQASSRSRRPPRTARLALSDGEWRIRAGRRQHASGVYDRLKLGLLWVWLIALITRVSLSPGSRSSKAAPHARTVCPAGLTRPTASPSVRHVWQASIRTPVPPATATAACLVGSNRTRAQLSATTASWAATRPTW